VSRSGGSLVLTIPREAARALRIRPGAKMLVQVEDGKLIYRPAEGVPG